MNRTISKNKLSICITIIVVLLAGSAVFRIERFYHKESADHTSGSVDSMKVSASNSPHPEDQSIPKADPATLDNLEMPILMYHYIRDLNDPNDKIGTNLSVSPAKFSAELDSILAKGYTTTTFAELSGGKKIEKPIILTFDDGYEDFYTAAFPELRKRNMKAVTFIIKNNNSGPYMTDAQLKEVSNYGIEIGSHTLSHPDLSRISTDRAKAEIVDSKAELEKITGTKVISFCYPSGKYNDAVIKMVSDAGYKYATTTNSGISKFNQPLVLNRHRINPDTNIGGYLK